MLIGYARVSTLDQNLDLQLEVLGKAGCKKIFDDNISGSRAERPGLTKFERLSAKETLWLFGSWIVSGRCGAESNRAYHSADPRLLSGDGRPHNSSNGRFAEFCARSSTS